MQHDIQLFIWIPFKFKQNFEKCTNIETLIIEILNAYKGIFSSFYIEDKHVENNINATWYSMYLLQTLQVEWGKQVRLEGSSVQ